MAIHVQRVPDDLPVGVKAVLPCWIAHHGNRRGIRLIVGRCYGSSQERMDPEHREIVAGDQFGEISVRQRLIGTADAHGIAYRRFIGH
jgi:hypothetical protein